MPGPRNAKLADQIKVILASTIERRVKDPRLGFVTITEVRLTGDNREATAFYTVLGDDEARAGTAAALESATGMLRSTVGQQLGMKFTPTLTFVLDATPEVARHIEDLLAQVQATDAAAAAAALGKEYAGEPDPYRKPREDDDEADQVDDR
ncbi:ribosome-binding factor A [Tessaracoccus lapidicaptus]|jgi:ribosome-binding factor A|uniref:Ribosome-binding factor A n=1 Tax=Tessaracoccus lapidicaptus TaxID=1427523 RepID=A0A1C0AKG2_9ACTN|nr:MULTISPECIES: 30S ribosome-binding factor RbfA [Tessaracoccus]AQX16826.1 ribosome-binding factor A [Tessaracoccus sp. T2.5-30]OCL33111.1 ribosome-binding factor A [Tessaracoccus lapidicaptus]VEP41610.1 Ribosome-binding factor A [Tessaracoccus lapidicaptus]